MKSDPDADSGNDANRLIESQPMQILCFLRQCGPFLSVVVMGKGLGIGVGCVGKLGTNSYGIVIHHVADGSVAKTDGRLR